jgi:hypothetical protein
MRNKIERASFAVFKKKETIMHRVTQCFAIVLFATAFSADPWRRGSDEGN